MADQDLQNLRPATQTVQKRPSTSDLQTNDAKKLKTPIDNGAVSETTVPLQIKKLVANARLPTRGSAAAAGWDLCSAEDTVIEAGQRKLVSTGLAMAIPGGCYGRVAPRSGLAVKHGINTGAGVIDADYRGEVKVVLFNFGDQKFEIKEGDRIAQLILERIYVPELQEVEVLEESVRGAGGFGSTGN
ncbi:deoxyuridine 5'-triphosphate nucleotidohydrolase [Ascobolus immersus RN42]|uniref:Deoxyuridine 5'-triphosphate nucleotidohydrolase n=1 Tax=Ascobolus immersus RN42 TaxID=1160509 RepID=A0A3N4I766_ASCIM|nr:deoxyuridine 5'-triphosphate nucleotidohydrolase [Ascobolus immersus RN42]